MLKDYFNARAVLKTSHGDYIFFHLDRMEKEGLTQLDRLPFSIRIMLESLLRQCNQGEITHQDVVNLAGWTAQAVERPSLPYRPARVIMQDLTGVPAVVDLAAMRSAVARLGGEIGRASCRERV